MKKMYYSFIGIDISKKTFDVSLQSPKASSEIFRKRFPNNLKGFQMFLSFLKKCSVSIESALFCMENTGVYHRLLANLLSAKNAVVWVESGFQIKWSMGLLRGKSDKVDADRIMTYAFRNQDKSRKYEPKDESLQQIGDFLSARSRVIDCIKMLKVPVKEMRSAGLLSQADKLEECSVNSIAALQSELKLIEKKILSTINANEEISSKYKYAISVKSVGFVAASYLLYYTNGFTKFKNAKQIASFSGVAPFEYTSGTSIKGRTKVHHMANKKLKAVLHMCAVSSLRTNDEMKTYFARKIGEGKNKMLVINTIRNKILSRVYSCVKNEREYAPEFVYTNKTH